MGMEQNISQQINNPELTFFLLFFFFFLEGEDSSTGRVE
jgi:hypothetical protein